MDAFVPLSDNLDKLPNFKKILDEKPAILNALAQSDKKLYLFPHLSYKYAPEVNWGFIYRKDIFDKNNIPAPKGPDSYYSALKKLKEIYPDSIPFINYYESDMSLFAQGWGVNSGFCLPDGSDKMVFGPATAEWKDFLAYFHKLYAEGLMDPEFFTSGEEAFSANVLQESKSFVFRGWFGRLDTLENAIKDKIPGYDLEAAFPFGPKTTIFREAQFLDYGTSVSASSKYISEVLQLFDYFLSPSGMELCSMGQKGVTYNVDGSGQIKYVGLEDKNPTMNELAKSFGIGINGILYASDPRSVNWLLSPNRQRAFDLLKDAGFTKEPQPMLSFTKAESEELTPINDALNKDYIEWQVNFIMGKVSINENWDAYIKVLEADGLKRAEEIYNAAYQRYIG
jgi:putative aldouronate transport system substrate-binding protein